jgi:hypothetical protein
MLVSLKQLRQLRDICRDPPRFVFREPGDTSPGVPHIDESQI